MPHDDATPFNPRRPSQVVGLHYYDLTRCRRFRMRASGLVPNFMVGWPTWFRNRWAESRWGVVRPLSAQVAPIVSGNHSTHRCVGMNVRFGFAVLLSALLLLAACSSSGGNATAPTTTTCKRKPQKSGWVDC